MRLTRTLAVVALLMGGTASAETLDQILARNAAARGPIRDVKSLRLTGKAQFGGGDFNVEAGYALVVKRPGMLRLEVSLQGLTQVVAYDGKEGWAMTPFGGRRDPEKQ